MLKYPLTYIVYITCTFSLGIISFLNTENTSKIIIFILIIFSFMTLFLVLYLVLKLNKTKIAFILILILVLISGYLYANLRYRDYFENSLLNIDTENVEIKAFSGIVNHYDGQFFLRERYEVNVNSIFDGKSWIKANGIIRLYNGGRYKLKINDKIVVSSTINLYKDILTNDNITKSFESRLVFGVANIYYRTPMTVEKNSFSVKNYLNTYAIPIRNYIKKSLSIMNPIEYSIAQCIVLGDKSIVPDSIENTFINAGIAHILVVSGIHLSIIYLIINILLLMLRLDFYKRLLISIFITFLIYVPITLYSIPVLRSSIMLIVFCITLYYDRTKNTLNSLFLTALIILILNPVSIMDISFQFSFLATFAIIIFFPIYSHFVRDRLVMNKILKYIVYITDSFAISVSVLVMLLPLSLAYFGVFNITSIVSNLYAVFLAFLILVISFISVITSIFSKTLSVYPLNTLEFITSILINATEKMSSLDFLRFYFDMPIRVSVLITFVFIVGSIIVKYIYDNKYASNI